MRGRTREFAALRVGRGVSVGGVALAVLLFFAQSAPAVASDVVSPASAAARSWLESVQNDDGSWGASADIRPLYTTAVVNALRTANQRSPAYFRGITWLENRAMSNVDFHARRMIALVPHGDDVTADREFLKANASRQIDAGSGSGSGWGLSAVYAPSARDTALALLALGVLGVAPDVLADVQAGLDFLKTSQRSDGSWAVPGAAAGDPIVTALGLRALASHLGLDPSVEFAGTVAASHLRDRVTASTANPLWQAHAALALMRWSGPADNDAAALIDALTLSQASEGSWAGDVYTTAIALEALSVGLGRDGPSFQEVVAVGDFGLRAAVNVGLGRNRGDRIRRGDLQSLTTLDAKGFEVRSLAGLEAATNLTFLDLRHTGVNNIAPIAALLADGATVLLQDTPWAGLMCDVSGDGRIEVGDVLLVTKMASRELPPNLLQQTRADIVPQDGPGDGVVDVGDAVLLYQRVRGISNAACP